MEQGRMVVANADGVLIKDRVTAVQKTWAGCTLF
jgi:hypothetical protein